MCGRCSRRNEYADANELIELERSGDNFTLVFTLTREMPARSSDFNRRVDPELLGAALSRLSAPPASLFACGTNGFVNAVTDAAIAAGIDGRTIRTERYGV